MILQDVLTQVISECWNDSNFKSEFVSNPEKAIKALTGKTVILPEGIDSIKVIDESNPTTVYINIPAEPNLDNIELSEKELEIVSGGLKGDIFRLKWIRCGTNHLPQWDSKDNHQTPPYIPTTIEIKR